MNSKDVALKNIELIPDEKRPIVMDIIKKFYQLSTGDTINETDMEKVINLLYADRLLAPNCLLLSLVICCHKEVILYLHNDTAKAAQLFFDNVKNTFSAILLNDLHLNDYLKQCEERYNIGFCKGALLGIIEGGISVFENTGENVLKFVDKLLGTDISKQIESPITRAQAITLLNSKDNNTLLTLFGINEEKLNKWIEYWIDDKKLDDNEKDEITLRLFNRNVII